MSCLVVWSVAYPPISATEEGTTTMVRVAGRIGGIESHKDTIHVAVITAIGQPVTDREFHTTVA